MPIVNHKSVTMTVSKEQLKGLFMQYDKNGDGLLDKYELREAFKRLGATLPGWRAFRALQHADANGDGFISEDELMELVKYALKYGYTVT